MSDLKCFKKVGDDFEVIDLLDLRKGDVFRTISKGMGPSGPVRLLTSTFEKNKVLWEATSDPFFNKEKGWGIDTEMVR